MKDEHYFIFKGKKSTDLGVRVVTFPDIIKPTRDVESYEVSGKNGAYHIDNGTYKSYTLSIACCLDSFAKNKQHIDTIVSWLDGFGDLIISQEKDKIYKACIINQIPISDFMQLFPEFLIIFEVQPLKKSVNHINEPLEITKKTILNNIGTVESEPIITIFGSGDIILKINDEEFSIKNIDQYITINSEFLEVYKDDLNQNNKYNNFDFPKFKKGKNIIDFIGDVQKVIVEPNWRWL